MVGGGSEMVGVVVALRGGGDAVLEDEEEVGEGGETSNSGMGMRIDVGARER